MTTRAARCLSPTVMTAAAVTAATGFLVVGATPEIAHAAQASVLSAADTAARQTAAPVITLVGVRSVSVAALEQAARQAVAGIAPSDASARTRAAADAVVREYRRRGFTVAQVVASDVQADGTLRLTVAEGVVRRVLVRGNRRTRASTIRAAVSLRPGDVYREQRADDDRDRLARLGIFEDVTIAPASPGEEEEAPPTPNTGDTGGADEDTVGLVDIVVRVRERRTGNVAATLGFGEHNGLVGYVDVSETNVAGSAHRASVQWQRFGRVRLEDDGTLREEDARSAYSVSYFVPFLGQSSTALGIDVYNKNTIFQPLFGSEDETLRTYERRRGATVRVGRQLGRGVSLFARARRDDVGYDEIPFRLDPPFAELDRAEATVGAVGFELASDTRDALFNPRRGAFASLVYENAGGAFGGNRTFGRTVLDVRGYTPLGRGRRDENEDGFGSRRGASADGGAVLAARLLGGSATGDVPLPEQFFIGGYELLRGYDLYSIRGDRMLLASLEARVPLGSGLQGALFVDYGNAWEPGTRASLSNLKAGVGAGLRFLTPIGPLRLDVAYGDEFKTYISLGQAY